MKSELVSSPIIVEKFTCKQLNIGQLAKISSGGYSDIVVTKIYGGKIVALYVPPGLGNGPFETTWDEDATFQLVPLPPNEKIMLSN